MNDAHRAAGIGPSLLGVGWWAVVSSLMVVGVGCASTQLATQWKNAADDGRPLRRVLVWASNARSLADRIVFERVLADELRRSTAARVDALYEDLPQIEDATQDQLKSILDQGGYDGVLTVRLIDIRQKLEVTTVVTPQALGYSQWWRSHFYAAQDRVRSVDVTSLEISLVRADGFELVWAGRTESYDIDAPEKLAEEVGRVVVRALSNAGLVSAPPES